MCVKNSETLIQRTVESVLNQDFPRTDMELIVVDGFSQDKTVEIIRSYLEGVDMKTRIFCENEGLGRARQLVVENAMAEYIVWVDGDMVLSKDFVRLQVEFMERNPSVGVAKGKYGTFKNHGQSLVANLENIWLILFMGVEGETTRKALGASGCIYRVKAIKQAGNFDPNMKGAGEDNDAENRIRKAGWRLCVTSALFFEMRRQTWGSLWKEYFWHGKGARDILGKDKQMINLYKMLPPVALFAELARVPEAYKLTHQKAVLFLPLHYVFKRIAWFCGLSSALLQKDTRKTKLL